MFVIGYRQHWKAATGSACSYSKEPQGLAKLPRSNFLHTVWDSTSVNGTTLPVLRTHPMAMCPLPHNLTASLEALANTAPWSSSAQTTRGLRTLSHSHRILMVG